jgi:hypothetical protein
VWKFVAEPHHLPDWWPGIRAVEPDRRGFAAGARWGVRTSGSTLFRRAEAADMLVVTAVEEERRFAFELVRARLRVELRLRPGTEGATLAELDVSGPLVGGPPRGLPRTALDRLHALCQTAIEPA